MATISKQSVISNKSVADVFVNRPIVWVPINCTIENALKVLKDNRILSMPVIDTTQRICVGVVDILDIATFLVAQYPSINVITVESLRALQVAGSFIAKENTVMNVINFARGITKANATVPVELTTPLLGLVDIFGQGVHRVPVVEEGNKLLNFISQSDLLRYFAENIYLLGSLGTRTVDDLDLVRGGVHYARVDASVVTALSLITTNKVSALPVVDMNGTLRGTFSVSDLKGIGPDDFPQLLRPLGDYLANFSPKSLFPLTCSPNDTLEQVILKLAATKVHRLWCVDENNLVQGVVSITDVMRSFIQAPMDLTPETIYYVPAVNVQ